MASYNWDDLRFLLAVYRSGTMSAAARELGTNVATVSRRIDRLASELGGNPFVKTPTGWRPTASVAGLLDAASLFDERMRREQAAGTGAVSVGLPRLRLGAETSVITMVLTPHLSARGSPMGRVDLEIVQRMFENGLGGHDIIIQTAESTSPLVVSRMLGTLTYGVYRWRGAPETRRWIGLSEAHEPLDVLERARSLLGGPPVVRLGDFDKVFQASRMLKLPATLPESCALNEPQLIRIDPSNRPATMDYWLVFHKSRSGDPVMQIVADWIAEAFTAARRQLAAREQSAGRG
jgi:DNA-binding transcriptional LysR family regulator